MGFIALIFAILLMVGTIPFTATWVGVLAIILIFAG